LGFKIKSTVQIGVIATGAGLATAAVVQLFNPQYDKRTAWALTIVSAALLLAGVTLF
jgi:hypothetical protein